MKIVIVLSLLAIMLTGCVKQTDYDDLVRENAKLENEIDELSDENKALQDKAKKQVILPDTENDNSILFSKRYEDESDGNVIVVYVTLTEDNYRRLSITLFPSMTDNDSMKTYEANCSLFLTVAMQMCKSDYYSIEIIDKEAYCHVSYNKKGNSPLSIVSYDRDEKFHNTNIDGAVADWLTESDPDQIPEPSFKEWLTDTTNQIEKDIEGIYP